MERWQTSQCSNDIIPQAVLHEEIVEEEEEDDESELAPPPVPARKDDIAER